MKTKLKSIESLKVEITRDKESATERLHIDVTISTFLSNLKIKEFSESDLYNLKIVDTAGDTFKLLKFDVYLINSESSIVLEKPVVLNRKFILKNKENANFTFDSDENSILLTDVKLNIKPIGTKRTVITYEDTDVIDDTQSTEIKNQP